jgi:hypothetical protein
VHETLARQFQDGFLEGPDEVQLAEHGAEESGIRGLPVGGSARQLDPGGAWFQTSSFRHLHGLHCSFAHHSELRVSTIVCLIESNSKYFSVKQMI